jgi:transposase-like protein
MGDHPVLQLLDPPAELHELGAQARVVRLPHVAGDQMIRLQRHQQAVLGAPRAQPDKALSGDEHLAGDHGLQAVEVGESVGVRLVGPGEPEALQAVADACILDWPYLWLDATYLKVRQGGRIVSVAATIAMAVDTDGRREIIGLCVGPSEAETFWTDFLRSLKSRGLQGVKLVISDAHTGLKAAIARVFEATWQRCRVHWIRNALAHVPKGQHTVVAAAIRQAFNQPDKKTAVETWRHVADQLRARWPKLADLMDESEADVLAYMSIPAQHRTKLRSTNPLERLNKEVQRRADVVGIFPNEDAIVRLIGAVLFEQNDEWQSQHRYMQVEAFAQIDAAESDPLLSITTQAA